MNDAGPFASRRARVLDALGGDGALIVPAVPEVFVGPDAEMRYLPDADLYWLTGYTEPEAVLVLCPSADAPYTLFVRPRDAERELWTGARGGVEAAAAEFGAAAHPIAELAARLPDLLRGATRLFAPLTTGRPEVDAAVHAALLAARKARPREGVGVHTVTDARVLLAPLRVIKDEHELGRMRTAADISVAAFRDVARTLRDHGGEWQVDAVLEYGFRRRGGQAAYPSIVAAGANATVLHYVHNDGPMRLDDLVLIDAGARTDMYCADITRTFPVGGRFSPEQRAVYDVVRAAHDAALDAVAPGRAATGIHDAALRVLVQGMLDLRLLDGAVDDIIGKKEYQRYYPHRTSHWLGLDVHDVGDYVLAGGAPLPLEPGMVLTVEPGLYVRADDGTAPAALRGIGVRLEDDVVVTARGRDVLTAALPLDPAEVEAMVRGR